MSNTEPKPASTHTRASNAAVSAALPFADESDFERAQRGLIAGADHPAVMHESGFPVWDFDTFGFVAGEAPDTVNPSLWRQARLNGIRGLFRVTDGISQVRGFDLSNITFIEGETGRIVIDPLTSAETAAAALALANGALGSRPVVAVIYTHCHADHFAGVRGVLTDEDVTSGRVRVIAPEGFLAAAISENVIAGTVMTRRATYMYGALLPRNAQGHVDSGLGKTVPLGTQGLIAPTESITTTGTELTIDGVRVEFQLTPGTEAPAEMNFLFPDHRALCLAENCTAVLHNVYTPRGAEIRDALAWSKYIDEARMRYAHRCDVAFASHHWPRWGEAEIVEYLENQRDLYRFIHDQTMRLANHGLTMNEIAEELALPASLGDEFYNRDYYGTVNHNAKAVYQKYLGWFDGNPAHLHPLPPVPAARKYVEFMGGADALIANARTCFERGEYRWVAEVVNHLVFAEPDNTEARRLQADALEQLGYQAESGPWRAFYLTGAQELRHGTPKGLPALGTTIDTMRALDTEMLFDLMGVRLDGSAAAALHLRIDLRLRDPDHERALTVRHGTLSTHVGRHREPADTTVSLARLDLARLLANAVSLEDLVAEGAVDITGDQGIFRTLLELLDRFEPWFDIVLP